MSELRRKYGFRRLGDRCRLRELPHPTLLIGSFEQSQPLGTIAMILKGRNLKFPSTDWISCAHQELKALHMTGDFRRSILLT